MQVQPVEARMLRAIVCINKCVCRLVTCSLCVYSSPLGTCKHVLVDVHTPVRASCLMCGCMCELVRAHVLQLRVTCWSNHICHGCRDISACVHEGARVCTCCHCCVRVCTPMGPSEVPSVCVLSSLHLYTGILSA